MGQSAAQRLTDEPSPRPALPQPAVLQGLLLSDANERLDSMNLLLYMAPVAVLALIPMTLVFESRALLAALQLGQSSPGAWAWWPGGGLLGQESKEALSLHSAWRARLRLWRTQRIPIPTALAPPRSLRLAAAHKQRGGLLHQPHQLPGHQAHLGTHAPGARALCMLCLAAGAAASKRRDPQGCLLARTCPAAGRSSHPLTAHWCVRARPPSK